jgi:Mn-dependent DtxR family transcriptional regulator
MTQKQSQYYNYIRIYNEIKGYSPTLAEIAKEMGVTTSTVQNTVNALVMQGLITKTPNVKGGIILADQSAEYWKAKYFDLKDKFSKLCKNT